MKEFIKDRKEIAKAMNFGKYTVVGANLDECKTDYGWDLGKVRIDLGEDHEQKHGYRYDRANLYIYKDEFELTTSSAGTCLSARFCLEDIKEMADYANAPILAKDVPFILFIYSKTTRNGFVIKMTPNRYNKFCSTPLSFDDANIKNEVISLIDIAEAI